MLERTKTIKMMSGEAAEELVTLVRLRCVDSQSAYKSFGYLGYQRRTFIVGCPQSGFYFFCLKSLAVVIVREPKHLIA